jgi:hypothetical protein
VSDYAQAPAVFNHSRALPQGDGCTGPAFTRCAVGSECNLIVLDASDVLHWPPFPLGGLLSPQRERMSAGHLPQSSSASRFTAGAAGFFILSRHPVQ